jgi:pilus assembly protein CpaF
MPGTRSALAPPSPDGHRPVPAGPVDDVPGARAAVDARVHQRVLSGSPDAPLDDGALAGMVRAEAPLLGAAEVAAVVARVRARIGGLGPLEPLLADPAVSDVLVNGPGPVWVERSGRLERTEVHLDTAAIGLLVERVVAPLGLRADRATPVIDARLPDGSRVHVVLPPVAVDGPAVTIRRFGAATLPLRSFCGDDVARLLAGAVAVGLNMVVSGGTGAGKTTLLNALCQHLPPGERVVTVEDAAELRLPGDHVVRLETRPPTPDGLAAVGVRDLVRAALRMRPDRIVVGEVRGAEALDMLQAMNTGHGGCLSTCHANGAVDALRRIETMALLGGTGVPLAAVRSQMLGAVDLVVHVVRGAGAARRVAAVAEVVGDDTAVDVRPLTDGGHVVATWQRPPRLAAAGLAAGLSADGVADGREVSA